jgi:drug/metabolite transporter (DMT)-like permease
MSERNSGTALGYGAMGITVAVWAGFALTLRGLHASPLQSVDVALLRFGVPTLLLLPLLPSRLPQLRQAPRGAAVAVALGAGAPFFFLAAAGGAHTSAAAVGTLIPGLVPAFVALARRSGLAPSGAAPSGAAERGGGRIALALVLAGVIVLFLPDLMAGHGGALLGAGMLVLAAGFWAAYTLGLERIGIDPLASALLLCIPSMLVVGILLATGAMPSSLPAAGLADVLPFLIVQGVGVGFLAAITYPVAVRHLGSARAALLGTASPVLVAILAVPLLGEQLGVLTVAGVVLVTAGVVRSQLRARSDAREMK